ncbi:MAG: hypothetical protein ACKVIB_09150, partial [Pseudomonadales bacterium]
VREIMGSVLLRSDCHCSVSTEKLAIANPAAASNNRGINSFPMRLVNTLINARPSMLVVKVEC